MLKNLRDIGGIQTGDTFTRKGEFFRCEAPTKITKEEFEEIAKSNNIKYVIDLRTSQEIKERPYLAPDGVTVHEIPLLDEGKAGISHEKGGYMKIMQTLPGMESLYKSLASEESAAKGLKKIFRFLLDKESGEGVLIHCTEGKDRTGVTTALMLSILGVDRESVFEDYMKSLPAVQKRSKKWYRLIYLLTLSKTKAKKISDLFLVKREYLQAFFDEIDATFGSLDNYVSTKLELTAEDISKLKAKYTEEK